MRFIHDGEYKKKKKNFTKCNEILILLAINLLKLEIYLKAT